MYSAQLASMEEAKKEFSQARREERNRLWMNSYRS